MSVILQDSVLVKVVSLAGVNIAVSTPRAEVGAKVRFIVNDLNHVLQFISFHRCMLHLLCISFRCGFDCKVWTPMKLRSRLEAPSIRLRYARLE